MEGETGGRGRHGGRHGWEGSGGETSGGVESASRTRKQ